MSVVNSILVVMREKLVLALMKNKNEINKKVWLFESHRLSKMLCECCIMYLHPYPALVGKKIELYNEILG